MNNFLNEIDKRCQGLNVISNLTFQLDQFLTQNMPLQNDLYQTKENSIFHSIIRDVLNNKLIQKIKDNDYQPFIVNNHRLLFDYQPDWEHWDTEKYSHPDKEYYIHLLHENETIKHVIACGVSNQSPATIQIIIATNNIQELINTCVILKLS